MVFFFNQPHHSCTLLFQDEETGMCVGMLPNGDTGVYHKSYVDDSVNEQHSVVWQTSWRNTYNEKNSLTMPQRMECSVKLLYSSETRYSMKIRLEPLVLLEFS